MEEGAMLKILIFTLYFGFMAGIGVIIGCYIHATRVNQTTVMSGVAFVRELPFGEHVVGMLETIVFSYQEKKDYEDFMNKYKGSIKIDPEVLKRHKNLYQQGSKQPPK